MRSWEEDTGKYEKDTRAVVDHANDDEVRARAYNITKSARENFGSVAVSAGSSYSYCNKLSK